MTCHITLYINNYYILRDVELSSYEAAYVDPIITLQNEAKSWLATKLKNNKFKYKKNYRQKFSNRVFINDHFNFARARFRISLLILSEFKWFN